MRAAAACAGGSRWRQSSASTMARASLRLVPTTGDPLASASPLLPDGQSALDGFLNRGKERHFSIVPCDAVIGDSAALAQFGLAAAVQVRISVFGAGEDPSVSELALGALSGLLDIVGDANGPPTRLAGHQLAYAAGLAACTGLLAALHAGGTEIVDVSLFDVATWLNWKAAAGMLMLGSNLQRGQRAQPLGHRAGAGWLCGACLPGEGLASVV